MKAFDYASAVVNKKIEAPKYVVLQCIIFLDIWNEKSHKYKINFEKLKNIEKILKLLIMPRGLKSGETIFDCSMGYQWLFFTSILCVVYRKKPEKRRYETAILEIGRKNFKTFTIATIFILLFLLEPKFSKFYSVAPDGFLSREVKNAIEEILKSSPKIYTFKDKLRFKIIRDYIEFLPLESRYTPLNYSSSRMDGKLPNVFLADEVGALPNSYAIESMRSGQLNILNKLGCIISTKYPSINNPFEEELKYAKEILDEIQKDETVFSLLFEPDQDKTQDKKTDNWMTDDKILFHANPVSIEIPEILEDLKNKRNRAIAIESSRENFLTKHCNILYVGGGTEKFIEIKDLTNCRAHKINWHGKEVYVGVDLSMTIDNTSVSLVSIDDDNKIIADSFCFIPEGRIEEKSKTEKLDYKIFIENKKCFACGNRTIDYGFVEDFVFNLEKNLGVKIKAIGFDRFNAISSAQKWSKLYNCVEIRQHSDTLHLPTKLLTEKITNQEFLYEKNSLFEINFANAKCTFDTNLNRYVNKKKSNGKVDMVVSLINAVYLLQQDVIFGDSWAVQVI